MAEMNVFLFRFALPALLSAIISIRALKRKSLDRSGALLGFLVMFLHLSFDFRFGALLLVFFLTSSKLTKFGEEKKREIDVEFKEGGQRNWVQVMSNSGIAAILVIAVAVSGGRDSCLDTKRSPLITGLIGSIIGHYACCNGDTWSSEIGTLSNGQPRLITTFKKVRKGTNGAISVYGTLASVAAGLVIGLTYVLAGFLSAQCASDVAIKQLLVIPLAVAAAFFGSLVDSFLGATLQFSGYCSLRKKVVGKKAPTVKKISGVDILDNNGVNVVSVMLTTLLTGAVCLYVF